VGADPAEPAEPAAPLRPPDTNFIECTAVDGSNSRARLPRSFISAARGRKEGP